MKASIVEEIIKQLTPERVEKEIKVIQKVKLPLNLQKWIKDYEEVGDRDEFIWKFWYKMFQTDSFPVFLKSPSKYRQTVARIKLLITMFIVQLDDATDKIRDGKLLDELMKIPLEQDRLEFEKFSSENKKYLVFSLKLWKNISKQIKSCPNYTELREVFNYDVGQVLNTMKYSHLVNSNPHLINKTEYWLYLPNNMAFMIGLTINMLVTYKRNLAKAGILREITIEAQKMGRVSNWRVTWQREIDDKDFTSGVFAYAIEKNILTSDELITASKCQIINKIKRENVENDLLEEWEKSYNRIKQAKHNVGAATIKSFLDGQRLLLYSNLASEGRK